jgi:hypothetical protein
MSLSDDTKKKQAYLRNLKERKGMGLKPLTWGEWINQKKMGGSKQTQRQLETLSYGDAMEIERNFAAKRK